MFGFIHRIYIEHSEDENNPLIYMQLCLPYNKTGVFKAGKSYMIRNKTKRGCFSKVEELRCLKGLFPDPNNPKPYKLAYGNYSIWDHKKWYCDALSSYVWSLTEREEAVRYITKIDKKIEYLTNKLSDLRPDYESLLSVELVLL